MIRAAAAGVKTVALSSDGHYLTAMSGPAVDDLFEPIALSDELDPRFLQVATSRGSAPARAIIRRVYAEFVDVDGNFRQQFQTTGFDARTWELALFAYLSDAGFVFDHTHEAPDFVCSKNGVHLAIEATTANPSGGGSAAPQSYADLEERMRETEVQTLHRMEHEMPIRFGSPLYSKLQRRYWELSYVKGHGLIFAIESFAAEDSLFFSETPLASYLYGRRSIPSRNASGDLVITEEPIVEHRHGDKTIPSGFFDIDGAEHVSAVIFSNSGTIPKFGRMAYQAGLDAREIRMFRLGFCHNPDPNASEPFWFQYDVATRPKEWGVAETWGEGMSMIHNPRALHPVEDKMFPDITHYHREGERIWATGPPFHPFGSQTRTFVVDGFDRRRP